MLRYGNLNKVMSHTWLRLPPCGSPTISLFRVVTLSWSIPIHQQGISCSVDQPHCSYVLKDGKVSQGCALLFYHLIFHSLNSRNTVLINQFAAHVPQVLQNRRNITAVPWSQREVFCHVQNSNWLFFWTLPKLLKIELLANFSERGDTNDYLSKIILSKVDR